METGYNFNATLALAHKVQKELVGAPSQFKEISDKFVTLIIDQQILTTRYHRVRRLSILLKDIDAVSSKSELDNKQKTDIHRITISCRNILIDLEKSVDSDDELWSSQGNMSEILKRAEIRSTRELSDIRDLQDRITTNVELLDAYLRRITNKDSVKSKDESDQTPLWWAARNGNMDMVKLLVDAGVDVDWKDNNDQTPLWWAACNNDVDMVQLLLDAGADIESKNTDHQTPLWWAARTGCLSVVKRLLDAGADVNSKDKNDQTPLSWAVSKQNRDMIKLLRERGAKKGSRDNEQTPLWRAARSSNLNPIKLSIDAAVDVKSKDKKDRRPVQWATQNLNANADVDAISTSSGNRKEDEGLKSPKFKSAAESLPFGQSSSVNQGNLRTFVSSAAGPDALREAVGRSDVRAVKDLLTQAFSDVARDDFNWLHELAELGYGYQDIATLLVDENKSPWIFIEPIQRPNPGFVMDHHHQASCVHQGGSEVTFSPRLIAEGEAFRHIGNCHEPDLTEMDSIKRHIATSCGLAGVVPVLNDRQRSIDAVAFDGDDSAIASVAYGLGLSHTTSIIQDCLLRVDAALERLVDIVSWLQQNGLCCNSFTILKLSAKIGRVELIQVPFSLISLLIDKVSCLRSSEKDRETIDSALKVAHGVLDLVYGMERDYITPFHFGTLDLESAERATVHNCALATQSLCLGLLSYSVAHAGPIKPFFLSRALKRVQLLGSKTRVPNKPCLSVDLVELTCFGQMIGNAVVAFTCTKTPAYTRKYDLLASPEDLVDTWGPGRFVKGLSSTKVERLYAIEIGGGVIRPTAEDAARFHWEKGILDYGDLSTPFDSRTKIIIAATRLNESCPLDQSRSWSVCNLFMENLGTGPDYWRLAEIQAGSQAGQYVMLQFNGKWVKQDGITLKDRQLNAAPETIYLPFLESLLGLQVSLCTGVARRVPIREMLADVMKAYVEKRLPVPTLWNDLLNTHKIVDTFQGPHMETWFQKLSTELQTLVVRIVRYILSILGDTGYNEQRGELVIACPFPEDPFCCFRIPCEKYQQLWTRALADSETCATFAYITPKCWDEPNGRKCQQSCVAKWRNRVVSLDTAVCHHKCSQEPQDQNFSSMLKPGIPYWIGKPGLGLKAKVLEPTTQFDIRLSITRSSLPESIRRRISRFPIYKIREKQQNVELNAIPVLISD